MCPLFYSVGRILIFIFLYVSFISNVVSMAALKKETLRLHLEEAAEISFNDNGFIAMTCMYFGTIFILVGAYYTMKHVHNKRKRPYQTAGSASSNPPISNSRPYVSPIHTSAPTNQASVAHVSNRPVATKTQASQPKSTTSAISPTVSPDSVIIDFGYPANWETDEDGGKVVVGEEEMGIKRLVYNLWGQNSATLGTPFNAKRFIHIVIITKNQNETLFRQYNKHRSDMAVKRIQMGGFCHPTQLTGSIKTTYCINQLAVNVLNRNMESMINEYYLFHGTKPSNIQSICKNGFGIRHAHPGLFGKGTYFAEDPKKSDQYTDNADTIKTTIIARVCLGELFVTDRHLNECTSPPCRQCLKFGCTNSSHKGTFDSSVADIPNKFREFIVYEDARAYPEYIVHYEYVNDDRYMREFLVQSDI